ncbi:MAG: hypothetical protein V4665_03465 [Patescibacteria group bacterium]
MRLFFPLLFIIFSGLLFFLIIDPLYKDVVSLRSDMNTYNLALDNSTSLQKTRDELLETYKNIKQEDRNRLDRFLPNTVNNIKFILEVEHIASTHNMPIKNIKFEAQEAEALSATAPRTAIVTASDSTASLPYGIFPIEFTTDGNYDSFVGFLKDLERNLRLVDVKGVSFSVPAAAKPGEAANSTYSYVLKVETYWLK